MPVVVYLKYDDTGERVLLEPFNSNPSLVTDGGYVISGVAEESCANYDLELNHPAHVANGVGKEGQLYRRFGGDLYPGETSDRYSGPENGIRVSGRTAKVVAIRVE